MIDQTSSNRELNIGILCRQNWTVNEVRDRLRSKNLPCDVLIGGTFFQSTAVREARALLEAIATPDDNAALLELCETRWLGGLLRAQQPPGGREADESLWESEVTSVLLPWSDRLVGLESSRGRDLVLEDLHDLRQRLESLQKLHQMMNPAALLAQCYKKFEPQHWCRPDVSERSVSRENERYQINLEHLIVLLDSVAADRPTTIMSALEWLRLQIATNNKEDEPQLGELGIVTALTVHKAKGNEFDYVIIPRTWDAFESKSASTLSTIVRADEGEAADRDESQDSESEAAGRAKLLWTWRLSGDDDAEIRNHDPSSASALREDEEQRREEARLLYVAMTRAREELMIYVEKDDRHDETWGELLQKAGK